MHFLVIPYLLLGGIFLLQFQPDRGGRTRASAVVTAWVAIGLFAIIAITRPVAGDSWRYYTTFLTARAEFTSMATMASGPDPLWSIFNLVLAYVGDAPWILYGGTFLVYLGVTVWALRYLFGPLERAALLVCMLGYPFFVSYAVSGLRQGVALAFLAAGYFGIYQKRRGAWLWILCAPFWHSGSWLAVAVFAVHEAMHRWLKSGSLRWRIVFMTWILSIGLSVSGMNQIVGTILPSIVEVDRGHEIYFEAAENYGYVAGFRLDFFVFSLIPIVLALLFRRRAEAFDQRRLTGWLLSLYVSLNIIYHLFSFAPFSDRFAAFSWWLIPSLAFVQYRELGSGKAMRQFVMAAVVINALMLQFYTGASLLTPDWLS